MMRAPESLAFALAVLVSSPAFAAGEAVELSEDLGLDAPFSTATTPPESSPIEHLRWSGTPIPLALPVGKDRVLRFPNEVRVGPPGILTERLQVTSADGAVYLRAIEAFEPTLVLVQETGAPGRTFALQLRAEAGASATPRRDPRPERSGERGQRTGGHLARCRIPLSRLSVHRFADAFYHYGFETKGMTRGIQRPHALPGPGDSTFLRFSRVIYEPFRPTSLPPSG